MQVLCKATTGNAEIHCCICGLGFVMYWDRQSRRERVAALYEIQETFRRQHRNCRGPEAHPTASFPVPEWNGATEIAGAVSSGTAQDLGI